MISGRPGSVSRFVIPIPSILLVTLLGIVLGTSACFEPHSETADGERPAAPNFELVLLDGRTLRLEDLRGKIVILDFWATWCAPCEVQMPVLNRLWKDVQSDHAVHDLMIVGVSVDTDAPKKVSEWIDERGFEYPIAIADQDLAMRYGVIGFPSLVFVDPDGRIHTRHTGVWSRPEIDENLARIRADRPLDE